jgi:hypothetical protein
MLGFGSRRAAPPPVADYYSSDTDLYRVEHVARGRAVLEDCRTGALLAVSLAYLERLRPVRPRMPAAAS